jgi:hypothetical protein
LVVSITAFVRAGTLPIRGGDPLVNLLHSHPDPSFLASEDQHPMLHR